MTALPLTIVVRTPERFVVCEQSRAKERLYLMVPNLSYQEWSDAERGRAAYEAFVVAERTRLGLKARI